MAILKIKWRLKNLQTGRDWINYKQCYTLDKADFQTKISFIQTNLKTTCTANHKQKHIRKQGKKGAKSRFSNSPSATVSWTLVGKK